jgi:tol-pal system protein YbgF
MEENLRKGDGMKGWIALSIGLLILGCATSKEVKTLDREIDRLHSRIDALQKENESLKNAIPVLKSNLAAENQKLKADLLLQLENLQSEIRILSTGIDEYKELLKRPSQEIDRIRGEMEARLRSLEEKKKTQEEKAKELEDRLKEPEGKTSGFASKQMESERLAATKEASGELKGISTGMGDLYKDAYETFYKGDLEGARRKFEVFLKQYPNTELSDNAQYWIGETYYLKKDYERAVLEYEKAVVKYPEGDKIPAALFKQALAFFELGDKTNARNLLRRVIEKYPRSEQAEMAKKKLETIK